MMARLILTTLLSSLALSVAHQCSYDFLIIGGGTSGLVVANRLTENPNISVLVVEYGYFDDNFTTLIPTYANYNTPRNLFNITSTPLVQVNNKPFPVNVAATVGGGSFANGMYFDRASAVDYDAWEKLGNPGWGWEGLFPYFVKSTNFRVPEPEVAAKYGYTWDESAWGRSGPIHASLPPFQWPEMPYFWKAWHEVEGTTFPEDGSSGGGVGVYWVPTSQDPRTQTRSDARTEYYDPVRHRSNLHLLTGTKVDKILFEGKTAIGVEMTDRETNITTKAFATKEVILAAGPILSPHLLQVSGIGPHSMLSQAGIEVLHDLPGVGMNFQDHATALFYWNFTTDTYPNPGLLIHNATFNSEAKEEYYVNRTGPWIQAHGNSGAFLPFRTIASPSAVEAILSNLTSQTYLPPTNSTSIHNGYLLQHSLLTSSLNSTTSATYEFPFQGSGEAPNVLLKPFSRGSISLNTTHPTSWPVVDYNTLSHPTDRQIVLQMLNFTRRYFRSPALAALGPVETISGTDEEVLGETMRKGLFLPSFSHQCGTNSMMPLDYGGVVDPHLKVYGIERLRVVDSSIIPLIPGTHLCQTVYAIAEKAADLIKTEHGCR